jgi:hypothetical protein
MPRKGVIIQCMLLYHSKKRSDHTMYVAVSCQEKEWSYNVCFCIMPRKGVIIQCMFLYHAKKRSDHTMYVAVSCQEKEWSYNVCCGYIFCLCFYRFSIRLIFGIVLTVEHLWFSFYSCIHTFSYIYGYGLTSLFCTLRTINRVPYLSRIRVLCVAQSVLLCAVDHWLC